MTDSYYPLMKATVATLKAASPITSLVGTRIYNDVPQKSTFPYIVVEAPISGDYSNKDEAGMEHTLDINIYSRNKSSKQAGDIRAKVIAALNRQEDSITIDGEPISNIYYQTVAMFKDPDGKTWHGVASFRVVII